MANQPVDNLFALLKENVSENVSELAQAFADNVIKDVYSIKALDKLKNSSESLVESVKESLKAKLEDYKCFLVTNVETGEKYISVDTYIPFHYTREKLSGSLLVLRRQEEYSELELVASKKVSSILTFVNNP